ncbi:DUF6221 family protein [Actinomadura decatromicini]|uniref:Uncharacterized protein n=1 Tax=Actinomadura decatromicini TaxID=2604572 RepID=A0A5D3FBN4_9ACTN|nr:DUF6221 family protein [Actinomadura decatromicini]TYK45150.1 hypothetical protein FXF68_31205 [Actinomadura decatromicini]
MDLVEFLRQRLREDEAAAKSWLPFGNPDTAARAHPARHNPGRVLREVEAKRRLIERYERAATIPASISGFVRGQDDGYRQGCLDAIHDAAAVYAEHPDYQAEWKP